MGANINKSLQVSWFSYLYLFMIVLYAGQSGGLTGLVAYEGNPIVFILPVLMTIVLVRHQKGISINKSLIIAVGVLIVWEIMQIMHHGQINASLTLFQFYQLGLCYVIVQVYQEKLFYVYEDIVYRFAVLSLFSLIILLLLHLQSHCNE